ncbi:hypothetical protein [Nocardia callitridis]
MAAVPWCRTAVEHRPALEMLTATSGELGGVLFLFTELLVEQF